jgi:hypothetical protein
MVLRSYQLRTLHLGDPGRATHLVSILQRMLPLESRLTEDKAANTLHVFSTISAQQAALEFIAAMDGDSGSGPTVTGEAAGVPEDVKKALASLAAARPDAEQLMKIVSETSRGTEERIANVVRQSQQDSQTNFKRGLTVALAAFGAILMSGFALFWFMMRRAQNRDVAEATKRESLALTLPSQNLEAVMSVSRDQHERTKELQKLMESFSIAYQADRQRNTMIMETVAKKHGELSATLEQMVELRREMGENAGRMFLEVNREAIDRVIDHASEALRTRAEAVGLIAETASRKMEETASRLEVQNARVEALADELERTQKEVDALFEQLRKAQADAHSAQSEANEQRRIAYERSAELAKKEAALAGLSLLMQEPIDGILGTLSDAQKMEGTVTPAELQARSGASGITPGVADAPLAEARDGNEASGTVDPREDLDTSPSGACENGDLAAASLTSTSSCPTTTRYTFRITPIT